MLLILKSWPQQTHKQITTKPNNEWTKQDTSELNFETLGVLTQQRLGSSHTKGFTCEAVTFPGTARTRKHAVTCAEVESCKQKAVPEKGINFPEQWGRFPGLGVMSCGSKIKRCKV